MTEQKLQQRIALRLGQLVDLFRKAAIHKQPLPPSHRVGPDHRVHRRQVLRVVLGAAAFIADCLVVALGNLDKRCALVRGSQTLQQCLVRRGETVVRLVSGCPKGIAAAAFGELADLQACIVGWNVFEGDVAVPEELAVAAVEDGFVLPSELVRKDESVCISDTLVAGL